MTRRPPRSTHCISSAASDVYKRQYQRRVHGIELDRLVVGTHGILVGLGCREGIDRRCILPLARLARTDRKVMVHVPHLVHARHCHEQVGIAFLDPDLGILRVCRQRFLVTGKRFGKFSLLEREIPFEYHGRGLVGVHRDHLFQVHLRLVHSPKAIEHIEFLHLDRSIVGLELDRRIVDFKGIFGVFCLGKSIGR
eukprot:TRINITY_DN19541_c0_g1_i1.p6 TRINITY_DN19541_c0_g1~~TRINITY_DN19541_c0_g1_i1.p6  ORF type:complete len:195 (-),score=11.17 TRINITY_DN19541_c0_g1_i1:1680-2264(-)